MDNKFLNRLSTFLFYICILIFIIAFGFAHNPKAPWNYQSLPFLKESVIADITFLDSLTGYAVTTNGISGSDTEYVLRTTDAGYNWNVILSKERDFQRVIFLNKDTGFILHGDEILRTTNAALSWIPMPVPPENFGIHDIYPLNWDTIWVCFPYIGGDFLYRSTNAGITWTRQLQSFSITKIYMFNGKFGFTSGYPANNFYKTTNSGLNWIGVIGNDFVDIQFIDTFTGWKAKGDMKKTTDGGDTWINQPLPVDSNFSFSSMGTFSILNYDTIWGSGGRIRIGNQLRGILYRTSNSGKVWKYQIPDTSIHNIEYIFNIFINEKTAWFYTQIRSGIHTTIGGDTNFITGVTESMNTVSTDFKLNQNYPNPFNSITLIRYELEKPAEVKVIVYNILGKVLNTFNYSKQNTGIYEIEFNAAGLSSGIYFYSLFADDNMVDTKRMILLK